jgi:hypothetical protein
MAIMASSAATSSAMAAALVIVVCFLPAIDRIELELGMH